MFNQGGLSLEQAPPIEVVLRFFLSAPFFGIVLGLVVFTNADVVILPHSPQAVIAIHLLFLGVISMSMIGALFQMLPVLVGAVIEAPVYRAVRVHALFTIGVIALVLAFWKYDMWLFIVATVALVGAVVYAVFLILPPMLRQKSKTKTSTGMQRAVASLAVTALLALFLLHGYINQMGPLHENFRMAHLSAGLLGWLGLLIITISFEVIEMFYVTPPYGGFCKGRGFHILSAAVALKVALHLIAFEHIWPVDILIVLLFLGFAFTTLKKLAKRKRPTKDATVWFWRTGLSSLALSALAWLIYIFAPNENLVAPIFLLYALFVLSVLMAMMYKIVPFLVWFHLNAKGYFDGPLMNEIIPTKRVFWHLYLHWALFVLIALSYVFPVLTAVSGAGLVLYFSLLGVNLVLATRMYKNILKEPPFTV